MKNTKKRLLSTFLATTMICSVLPAAAMAYAPVVGAPITGGINPNGSQVEYTVNAETKAVAEKVVVSSADMDAAAIGEGGIAQVSAVTQGTEEALAGFGKQLEQVIVEVNASDLNKVAEVGKSLLITTDAGTWELNNIALKTLYTAEYIKADGATTNPDGVVQFIANKTVSSGWSISLQKFVTNEARAVINKNVIYNMNFTEADLAANDFQNVGLIGSITIDNNIDDSVDAITIL